MNQNFMDTLVMQVIKGKHATIWPQKYTSAKYVYPYRNGETGSSKIAVDGAA